jgi:hypothetical protein
MQIDSLDFKNMGVGKLFTKQLFPTLLGMISSALFTVVDRIFVGRGIGSDAVAAVNITASLAMVAAGVGLMFGMGDSILALIIVGLMMTLLMTLFLYGWIMMISSLIMEPESRRTLSCLFEKRQSYFGMNR